MSPRFMSSVHEISTTTMISQMTNQPSFQMSDDFEDLPSLYEREENMVAAAQNMVKLLATHRHADDHLRKILSELDTKLTAMKLMDENKENELTEIKERLSLADEKIKAWGSNQGMIWDSYPDLFSDYLASVDEVRRLAEYSRSLSSMGKADCEETIQEAENILQVAMVKVEEELRDIFAHSLQSCISNTALPSSCCEEEVASVTSDESILGSSRRESSSSDSGHYVVADLVCADSIPVIKSIAHLMFSANYNKEFCEAIEASQKEALDEFLIDLGVKSFTIEELIKMDWKILDSRIKTWIRAVRIFVQVYLAGEKRLLDQIFEEVGPTDPAFFANIANSTMMCLLNFGQGVAMGTRKPEKLFALLNMVEVLREVSNEVYELFSIESTSSIKVEVQELTTRLGSSAKATFLEFGDLILSDPAIEPFPAGRIHHLTKYVMNYLNTLPAYTNIVNLLLQGPVGSDFLVTGNQFTKQESNVDDDDGKDTVSGCLMAVNLRSILDNLETNLDKKSQLYRDSSLKHIFLLNNIHYIVHKIMDSELRAYFGDDWIRKRMSAYLHEATCYHRSTWGPVVPLLLDESGSGSGSSRSTALRDKLRNFTSAFEEVYKVQTGWLIRDDQLKQELRISITQRLVPAYQNFVNRCKKHNLERHVKYEADDLVDLIDDLFEGLLTD
ncbi:hypothetical protein V2J09_020440 [Rumex salicifolius]